MTRSPFPGMDPWLQRHWRDVYTALLIYARDALQAQLPGDLFARVEESVNIDDGEEPPRTVVPDVKIVETPGDGFWQIAPTAAATAVAEPMLVLASDQWANRHLEILDASNGNRVVTAIEWLSPSNKDPWSGRDQYREKQKAYRWSSANLVEIDLIRGGVHTIAIPPELVARKFRSCYLISVNRAIRPDRYEFYAVALRDPLPTIRIPLRPRDGDITLNLQQLIDDAYQKGRYRATIDYRELLDPPLSEEDAAWVRERLQQANAS